MKTRAIYVGICFLAAGLAHAGFRHPVEETGLEAQQIQSTPVHMSAGPSSAARVMPDRVVSAPAVMGPPASAAPQAPRTLPANAKSAPQPSQHAIPVNAKASVPAMPAPQIPRLVPQGVKPSAAQRGPVPKAPALPSAEHRNIPDVNLPNAVRADGQLSIKPPEKLSLRGLNRPQIHAFLKHARGMREPNREYTKEVRSREIAERYKDALHPVPGKSFRTAYSLGLAKVAKIIEPPAATQYENMVKRIDSLFMGLEFRYPKAVLTLWQLAESPTNARELQARDALFAGLISERAGWETTTAMMLEEAAAKSVDHENRYLQILWNQLDRVNNPVHLDKIVAAVSPIRARDGSPLGDRANYALAKRMLTGKRRGPELAYPSHEVFQQRIASVDMRDKLSVLAFVGQLRSKQESRRQAAVTGLRAIESGTGSDENRQQARLALARTLLQHGAAPEALELYRHVRKDGKNRLAVLGEQTYAEYASGEYQESLGKTVALETPYFRYGFAPDVHLVEILSRKAMCDFGGAEAGVKRFAERYAPELEALDKTIARKAAPGEFYDEMMANAGSEQPLRYQRFLLQLPTVMENQKTMNQALAELDKLDALAKHQKLLERPEGWDTFTAAMRKRWADRAGDLRRGSGREALREVAYLAQRLHQTFAQVELLDLDVSTGAAKNYNLQSALNFPARKQEEAELAENQLRWPFETEIWEDEIDYMKAKNPSKCAKTASL